MRDYRQIQSKMAPEQRTRYNKWKERGDRGEKRIYKLLTEKGYALRESTTIEDLSHKDFILEDGRTIDVKNKYSFALELTNYNGNKGWLFTGADVIIQCFENSKYWGDDVYMYNRKDMLKYYYSHPGLFKEEFCNRGPGKSVIWNLGKKRLSEMNFVTKLN